MSSCSATIFHCMDFRIQQAVEAWLNENNLAGDTDRLSIPGPVSDPNQVVDLVQLSLKLHQSKRIVLTQHLDCGYYGGRAAFDSDQTEHDKLLADMTAARDAILRVKPGLQVDMLFVVPDGDKWKVVPA